MRISDWSSDVCSSDLLSEPLAATARPRPWIGNVVAVGPAAGEAPMLDGAELLLLQLAIAQLVLLWPIDRAAMPEADIYNEEMVGTRARSEEHTSELQSLMRIS